MEIAPRSVKGKEILHEFYIQVINCSLKFLSESSKLCEVNVIGKNVWFIQIPPLLLFSLNSRHYSITSSLIFFLDKGETIEVRFYKQPSLTVVKVFINSRLKDIFSYFRGNSGLGSTYS